MRTIEPLKEPLRKEITVPGDKSISHRAIMLSSISDKTVEIRNFLTGEDCLSTIACLKAAGVKIEQTGSRVLVKGCGLNGLCEPEKILDAGNSGTTVRLLTGLMAGQGIKATFTGDESLRRRPMDRIINPLREMGAKIIGEKVLPITLLPSKLRGIRYELPVASAQVKSAILLAGLNAAGMTTIIEPVPCRDHTEKMLRGFGVSIEKIGNEITLKPPRRLEAPDVIEIPGDISSAAYWLVLATCLDGSDVLIKNVGVNETRTGIIDVIRQMGGRIELINERTSGGEPLADLKVTSSKLHGVEIGGEMIPRLIDEVPIIAVAAAFAEGATTINGLSELRHKESDRLAAIVEEYVKIGIDCAAHGDTLTIRQNKMRRSQCKTRGDHRLAMSLAIAGMLAEGVTLDDTDCINISYPNFI